MEHDMSKRLDTIEQHLDALSTEAQDATDAFTEILACADDGDGPHLADIEAVKRHLVAAGNHLAVVQREVLQLQPVERQKAS
jgi:hypothetical protein